ncbi:hypothetical protein Pan241w_27280 [Gimesia alba]|uniref:Glycosyltransferase RgtA/B/C/D-like domain-containing protein n=1 Tax=Gimesia alba TaxID=2527973 RepID=A0A517RFJ5_9PLAN|nr:glycosyltransferase family 39 protein [Gimesia alba]QDT42641.1 hypothetical protein Pan241w_27280 [Gimesia alba]
MPILNAISSKQVHKPLIVCGAPLLLGALILVQTSSFRSVKSPTFDETFFLNTALTSVDQSELDQRISGEGVAPIPILLTYLPVAWSAGGSQRSERWQGEISDPPLINQARLLNALLVGIPTMLLIYFWLLHRRGFAAGFLGAALVTFSPTMIAHFSLATTDACFTLMALIALATLTRYWKAPSTRNLCWLAIAVSLAISAKYSGIFLLPCVLIIMVLVAIPQISAGSKKMLWLLFKRVTVSFSLLLLLLIPFTWAFHLFGFSGPLKTVPYAETPDYSAWVRVLGRGPVAERIMEVSHTHLKRPAPFAGVLFQFLHNSAGHDAYLMGQVSNTGWWYYFPLTWLWKSTPVELLLTVLGLILSVCFLLDLWKTWRHSRGEVPEIAAENSPSTMGQEPTNHAPLIWILAIAVLLGMSLTSRLNLGQRYLLTVYPLMFLFTIDQFMRWFKNKTFLVYTFAGLCFGFQILAITSIQPHYLAYFNGLVGGPEAGHKYLLDSNMDWGQDLPALKAALADLPPDDRDRCLLYYFGTARPEAYGISVLSLKETLPDDIDRWSSLALSVNHLQGLYTQGKDPFEGFRSLKPLKRAGYSIFLYDLKTPEAKQALQESIATLRKMQANEKTK